MQIVVNQSINQIKSINQSINQIKSNQIKQSINQSIKSIKSYIYIIICIYNILYIRMRRFLGHDTCGRDYLTPVVADGSTRGNINHPTIAWVKKMR
jgi:hypothetical protein